MINFYDSQNRVEIFVQYLNKLAADHYGALYHRKKDNPIDDDLLSLNAILGIVLYACASRFPYPEREITHCSMEAQRQLPPAKNIYKEWIKLSLEAMVTQYCKFIDRLVEDRAIQKNPNRIVITCSLFPRCPEIVGRLHMEAETFKNAETKPKKIAY